MAFAGRDDRGLSLGLGNVSLATIPLVGLLVSLVPVLGLGCGGDGLANFDLFWLRCCEDGHCCASGD